MNTLKVCWISAGVSSFVAGYLARETVDKYIYIDIEDQHPDSMRFIQDCEKALGKECEILRSSQYRNVEECIIAMGNVGNLRTGFYPCTAWLKKRVRKEWEYHHQDCKLTYVWGLDWNERQRAEKLVDDMPEYIHEFPLIDYQISKNDAHAICASLGIKRPIMYDMGYTNNNCVGCVKGGMGYWNKIRRDFPDVFERRAKMERRIGNTILKGWYLDELPINVGRMGKEIMVDRSIFCQIGTPDQWGNLMSLQSSFFKKGVNLMSKITKSIRTSEITCAIYDTETQELGEITVAVIGNVKNDAKTLKRIRKEQETERVRILSIKNIETTVKTYCVDLDKFLTIAEEVTRKPLKNTDGEIIETPDAATEPAPTAKRAKK